VAVVPPEVPDAASDARSALGPERSSRAVGRRVVSAAARVTTSAIDRPGTASGSGEGVGVLGEGATELMRGGRSAAIGVSARLVVMPAVMTAAATTASAMKTIVGRVWS